MNLLVYYNVNQKHFYIVYTNYVPLDKEIGYINQFNHILVQILVFNNGCYINVSSFKDLLYIPKKKDSLKVVIINKLIRWLYKLRG